MGCIGFVQPVTHTPFAGISKYPNRLNRYQRYQRLWGLTTVSTPEHMKKQLRNSLFVLIALFGVGALGFSLLGNRDPFESLFLATVILTTVGLKEGGADFNNAEKVWCVLLMIMGIGAALYATGNIVAFFIDGQIRAMFGRRQQMSKINHLKDHVVVIGFGRMGRAICQTLTYRGIPFVLIDNNEHTLAEVDALGYLYHNGDAMHEQTLFMAGIDRARGLATCLSEDADNVFVTLTARSLNERMHIISRSEDVRSEVKMVRAGANRVICAPVIGASRMTHLLLNPVVDEFLELDGHWPDIEITKLSLRRFPEAVGKTLAELSLTKTGAAVVIAIVSPDGTRRLNPEPDTELQEGDEFVIAGSQGSLAGIIASMGKVKAAA